LMNAVPQEDFMEKSKMVGIFHANAVKLRPEKRVSKTYFEHVLNGIVVNSLDCY
jgi:hypothetical protein